MEKGGISAVVATVLIILITVASVTIVWTMVLPLVKDDLGFSELEGRVEIVTSGGYTVYDVDREIAIVQVKRGFDDLNISGIRILFSIEGDSYGSSVVTPDSGQARVYNFNMSGYGKPERVWVVPIFVKGKIDKEGDVTSDVEIFSGKIYDVSGIIYQLEEDYIEIPTLPSNDSFVSVSYVDNGDYAYSVWGNGTYIYLANSGGGLRAYTHNGTNFTESGDIDSGENARGIWGDSNYIYLANGLGGLRAYTHNGTSFTQAGNIYSGGYALGVWGDGNYIYIANNDGGLRAYTHNGTNFTESGDIDSGNNARGVWGDSTYIYLANGGDGLRAYL